VRPITHNRLSDYLDRVAAEIADDLVQVASLDPDGSPNVSPVWVELDGDDIVINTALGRAKARNLASDSRVAISLTDPDDPGKKERYQAEALIWQHVPLKALLGICCYNAQVLAWIQEELAKRNLGIHTSIQNSWYFQ